MGSWINNRTSPGHYSTTNFLQLSPVRWCNPFRNLTIMAFQCDAFKKNWTYVPQQTSGNPPLPGPRPVKTVEDRWKSLLCQSSWPVKILVGRLSMETLCWKNYIRTCKSFGGPVKLGFSMWLLVLRSGKGPKVFPMSGTDFISSQIN